MTVVLEITPSAVQNSMGVHFKAAAQPAGISLGAGPGGGGLGFGNLELSSIREPSV